ncbi:thioredoxin family protein [Naasia sp.]|uniref:thioredoxin family protein n=1 Tax=Naasia sp. TaxID=2546198 RepID=UPI002603EC96|nr:thioredoxin family protein [Naasia sp.]
MPAWLAVTLIAALVAVATATGVLWRVRAGRVRIADPESVVTAALLGADAQLGERATLLQFSTEFCARCPGTHRVLAAAARDEDGVEHVDVDLTHRPDLARRFKVLQTPTVLLLDAGGAVRGRVGGAPRPAELRAALTAILNGADDVRTA